jgi:hypothetical protein
MKFLGTFKVGDTIRYSVNFHDDANTTVDPDGGTLGARHRKPDDSYADLAAPTKLDTKTGWFGGSIDTTGFAVGSHEVRIKGEVGGSERATVISFELENYDADNLYDAIAALNNLSQAEAQAACAAALVAYDPPTKTEMTAEHSTLSAEHTALPAANDVQLSGVHGAGSWQGSTPAAIAAEVDTVLSASHGAGQWTGSDPASVADAVWDEAWGDHKTLTTFGGMMLLSRGMTKFNWVMDNTEWDANNNMLSARIRLFETAALATVATKDAAGLEGAFASITVTGEYLDRLIDFAKFVEA